MKADRMETAACLHVGIKVLLRAYFTMFSQKR